MNYKDALWFQKEVFKAVHLGLEGPSLILCNHNPVITLGRTAKRENILFPELELEKKGIEVYETERGGGVTYHGPGQLIAYPIFNLARLKKDIHWFLRELEHIVIDLLATFGIQAKKNPDLTGVWLEKGKISSIGIAIKHWITFHGLSINLKKDDLDNFQLIRPCGMDIRMTSLESELNKEVDIEEVKKELIVKFKEIFNFTSVRYTDIRR